jgi:hypothetical protein
MWCYLVDDAEITLVSMNEVGIDPYKSHCSINDSRTLVNQ